MKNQNTIISAEATRRAVPSNQQPTIGPSIVRRGEGRLVHFVSESFVWKLEDQDTGDLFALAELEIVRGEGPPPHAHAHEDELFLVLEGEVTILLGTERHVAGPGDVLVAPRRTVHCFGNETGAPARMLVLVTPPALVKAFDRVMQPEKSGETPADLLARLGRMAPDFGLTIFPDHPLLTAQPFSTAQPRLPQPGQRSMLLAAQATPLGTVAVHALEYSRNQGESTHSHHDQDEVLIIVDQLFEVVMGETSTLLHPGDMAYIPSGVRHSVTKPGAGLGRAISIHHGRAAGSKSLADSQPPRE